METSSQPIKLDSVTVVERQDEQTMIGNLRSGGQSEVNDVLQGRFVGNNPALLVQHDMELIADFEAKLAKSIDEDSLFGETAIARCHELIPELTGENGGESSEVHCELQALLGQPCVMLQPGYVNIIGHLIESSYDSPALHALFTYERLDQYEFMTVLKDGIDERHLPVMMDLLQSNAMTESRQKSEFAGDIGLAADNRSRILRSLAHALIAFNRDTHSETFELRLMLLERLRRDIFFRDQNLVDEAAALMHSFSAAEIDSIMIRDDVPNVKRSLL